MTARLIAYLIIDGLYLLAGLALLAQYGAAIRPAWMIGAGLLFLVQVMITITARR